MRSAPPETVSGQLRGALAAGWGLRPASLEYVPKGAGSYHWIVPDGRGRRFFVTVDDLDNKPWIGSSRAVVYDGLRAALSTAVALRNDAGLRFVVAPIAATDGQPLGRLDGRHTACVFPFEPGQSHQFGAYADARLRNVVLDMIATLHEATAAVRGDAPRHVLGFTGRADLDAFLVRPDEPWLSGPWGETARGQLTPHVRGLGQLVAIFDQLAVSMDDDRSGFVISHGEPHPGNVIVAGDRAVLIDWDTVGLGPPERDLALLGGGNESAARYQAATGRELKPALVGLYQLRWFLDDVASAVRLFRNTHRDTADNRRWQDGLGRDLAQLPGWLERWRASDAPGWRTRAK
jgi:spectinomycin phosphotransferase